MPADASPQHRRGRAVLCTPDHAAGPVVETIDVPPPGPGEIMVQVVAAGVNPTDWKSIGRTGPDPVRMGSEAAGVIAEVGSAVPADLFAVGDEVIVFPAPGAWASELVAPIASVVAKPGTLTFAQAANLLSLTTALISCTTGILYGLTGTRAVLGQLTPTVPWPTLGFVVAVSTVAGVIASLLPARRMTRGSVSASLAVTR